MLQANIFLLLRIHQHQYSDHHWILSTIQFISQIQWSHMSTQTQPLCRPWCKTWKWCMTTCTKTVYPQVVVVVVFVADFSQDVDVGVDMDASIRTAIFPHSWQLQLKPPWKHLQHFRGESWANCYIYKHDDWKYLTLLLDQRMIERVGCSWYWQFITVLLNFTL